jgi:hypothetical protein
MTLLRADGTIILTQAYDDQLRYPRAWWLGLLAPLSSSGSMTPKRD